jgi:SpoU rRNA methylase family enzyme
MDQARDCVDLQEMVDMDIMLVYLQVRAEITSKEKEEEDMIEKVTKEVKYVCSYFPHSSLFSHSIERYFFS